MNDKLFKITQEDSYIRVEMWGAADINIFETSTKEMLALHNQTHINRLLCDVREMESTKIDIAGQARSMGTLWQIRTFERVAFLTKESYVAELLHGALSTVHFTDKFQTFEDEAAAVAWLKAA